MCASFSFEPNAAENAAGFYIIETNWSYDCGVWRRLCSVDARPV